MRSVESSFLRRSVVLSLIAVFALGLGGCIWDDGYRGNNGRRGWDNNDYNRRGDYYDNDRHDHDGDDRDRVIIRRGPGRWWR